MALDPQFKIAFQAILLYLVINSRVQGRVRPGRGSLRGRNHLRAAPLSEKTGI